jgi:hypothetical protein
MTPVAEYGRSNESCYKSRPIEHILPKWKPVRREEYAQGIDLARILIDRTMPSDRKAR